MYQRPIHDYEMLKLYGKYPPYYSTCMLVYDNIKLKYFIVLIIYHKNVIY